MLFRYAARGALTATQRGIARSSAFQVPTAPRTCLRALAQPITITTSSLRTARLYSSSTTENAATGTVVSDADSSSGPDPTRQSFRSADNETPLITFEGQPILWPPFTLASLRPSERAAYDKHGVDFVAHLANGQGRLLRSARFRANIETMLKEKYGEDWFEITETAQQRLDVMEAALNDRNKQLKGDLAQQAKKSRQKSREEAALKRFRKRKEIEAEVAREVKARAASG